MWEFFPAISDVLSEVITGAIGGLVVAIGAFCLALYKRKRFEAMFPVAGRYISFFEDLVDGKQIVMPSVSDIQQKGNTLKITTKVDGSRSWTLTGTIMPGGHVSGVYSADAVYDEGVGSFYLKISKDSLDGMWNGYDHENKITNAGRYWFKKIIELDIRKFRNEDLNDILHTSSNAFGHGYMDKSDVRNDKTHFAIVCESQDEFCGFCIGSLQPAHSIADLIRMDSGVLPDDVRVADEHGTLGVIKSIVVRRKFRSHGAGTQLVQAAEKELARLGCECILVPAWSKGEKANIANILEGNDYARWVKNDTYWKTDCEQGKFQCVSFENTCQCSVIFYRKGRI